MGGKEEARQWSRPGLTEPVKGRGMEGGKAGSGDTQLVPLASLVPRKW